MNKLLLKAKTASSLDSEEKKLPFVSLRPTFFHVVVSVEVTQPDQFRKVFEWMEKQRREEVAHLSQGNFHLGVPDGLLVQAKPEGGPRVVTRGEGEDSNLILTEFATLLAVRLFTHKKRLFAQVEGEFLELEGDEDEEAFEQVRARGEKHERPLPEGFLDWIGKAGRARRDGVQKQKYLPIRARQCTFIEARSVSDAIGAAHTGEGFQDVEGENAVLHSRRYVPLQTRFQPSAELLNWRGVSPTKKAVFEALKELNFETNVTFKVTLACLLQTEHARCTFTLDEIIKLIGRDADARRNSETRHKLRCEVWNNLLSIASMPVIGARNGTWREPGVMGEKRPPMPKEKLTSRDPLLVITGTKSTGNSQEPPKEVSLAGGEWIMAHIGNREMLSDFGDVLKIAQIPRGKVSGAWAACAGLALQHLWREESAKAEKKQVSRGKTEGPKVEVLKFRPFTRRELLTEMFRCDDENNPTAILSDPKGRRARAEEYWQAAIELLRSLSVVGYCRQVKNLDEMEMSDLNEVWLNQPFDIRPSDEILKDALEIHNAALEAKKRGRPRTRASERENSTQEVGAR